MNKTGYGSIMITDSTDGVNAALVNLYKQTTQEGTAPSVPSTTLTYTFAQTNPPSDPSISGNLGGWSLSTSNFDSQKTTWIITAMALSSEATDTIASNEWSVPVQVSTEGISGKDGLNQATIFLYTRSNSTPNTPNGGQTYTFLNGNLSSIPTGWNRSVPIMDEGHNPCYVTTTVVISSASTAIVGTWAAPALLAENGRNGEDGFSPVVSETSTGIKIVDKNNHTYYINNGTNGQTYYTHIRYSSKSSPTSANDVSASPTGKSYVGIQTTTNEEPPAWNNSGWTWIKYVGENGQQGIQGIQGIQGDPGFSVTSVRTLYYLTQGSQPSKPTSSTTIVNTNTNDVWTTVLPGYIVNGKYYISLETTLSNSTKVWSNVSLDQATTDANYNAYLAMSLSQHAEEDAWGALSIASDTTQWFWNLTNDYSTNVKAGTYITKVSADSFKSNPSTGGANIFMQNAGIWLRNGLDNLATLQGSGLYLYIPEGSYKGKKGMSLTSSGLTFYNIDSTNGTAATLNANGLRIARGGVYGGSTSDLNNFVFLSTQDFGNSVTVSNHAATDWRLLVNNKFGVDKAGNLYASNATIKGYIEANSGSISDQVTIGGITSLDIKPGDNFLKNAKDARTINITTTNENYTSWYEETAVGNDITKNNVTDTFFLSYDWKATNQTVGDLYPQILSTSTYIVSNIVFAMGTNDGNSPHVTLSSSNTSGHVELVFKLHATQAAKDIQNIRLRCYQCTTTGGTVTISNVVFTRGGAANAGAKFLTHISATEGVKVHSADNTNDYIQINSNKISMYKNAIETLKLENSAIRVGKLGTGLRNVYITDSAVQIRNNASVLVEYGSSVIFYKLNTDGTASTTQAATINSTGINIKTGTITLGSNFSVNSSGVLTATEVDITGKITASSGKIGGWNIGTDTNKSLYYGNQTPGATTSNLILSPTSATNSNAIAGSATGLTWFISAGKVFGVTTAGALYSTSGKIGGWSITASSIQTGAYNTSGTMYFGNSGISLSNTFKVTAAGFLTATSGTIGGFSLSATQLNVYGTASGAGTSSTGLYRVLIQSTPGTNGGNAAVGVATRSTTSDSWVWQAYMNHNGKFVAKQADITGKITATSGSFDSVSATNFTFTSGSIAGAVKIGGSSGDSASTVLSNITNAAKTATNYITNIDSNNGITIKAINGTTNTNTTTGNYIKLNASGLEIYNKGISVAKYGDTARVGKASEGHVLLESAEVKICWGSDVLAHIGYSDEYHAQYYTFGSRKSNSVIGLTSFAEGMNVTSSSWATHAEGRYTIASGYDAHAEGNSTTASGYASHAGGTGTIAKGACQTAIGSYNVAQGTPAGMDVENDLAFIIGNGDSDARSNALTVSWKGDVNIASGAVYKVNNTVVASTRVKTTITPTASGVSNYSNYGNSYYEKAGNVVHVHIGVKGVTANTVVAIATLPSGYRPTSQVFGHGTGGTSDNIGYMDISTAGVIQVRSATGYISADITYLV